ncbi:exodeoxyribonuclease VII small subunit [Lederbergia citrea]|uniref:Exodeoxyribonuclease 7 small subunit n=1 Tax=Lederbergia citrea TaxID=2833581 RepID=A0A942UP92_9BACI|nr:exodeoxyribonuclease VII small subunit [Lederbergia citrea]MBS4176389.1 exodeoxyribonuclease VII small subunit [Lederbergia citrea]MBS4202950.1 exodeoxyribonuclease VII small subunit [Lederbergia citrea]MBS4222378.1 exodeoxyribonuclease VII small subunit [Lederbergia citrea]
MNENLTFEEAMDQLEVIVQRLEEGDIPLEEALDIYKKGMELSKLCHDKLKNAEEQLTKVLTDDGEEDFHLQEEGRD